MDIRSKLSMPVQAVVKVKALVEVVMVETEVEVMTAERMVVMEMKVSISKPTVSVSDDSQALIKGNINHNDGCDRTEIDYGSEWRCYS